MAKDATGRRSNTGSDTGTTGSSGATTTSATDAASAPLGHDESVAQLRLLGFVGGVVGGTHVDVRESVSTASTSSSPSKAHARAGSDDNVTGGVDAPSGEDDNDNVSATSSCTRALSADSVASAVDGMANQGCLRRRLLSPLEVYYSQAHIRPEFQDGSLIEDGSEQIDGKFLSSPPGMDMEVGGLPVGDEAWWLLKAPFPEIEVIQWRCKLRKEDGDIKTDDQGNELYGEREWYTLDNRRLYCLQRAAVRYHPAKVRCAVIVILQEEGNCREYRKFRTPDLGRTIAIGHRDSPELKRWSWRREADLPEEPMPAGTPQQTARPNRRRNGPGRGPNSGDRRGGRWSKKDNDDDEEEDSGWDPVTNVVFFVCVYALLRIAFHFGKPFFTADASGTSGGGSPPPGQLQQ